MAGQAQAFYADGTPIPDSELAAAVSSGKAHFERGAQVMVRDADGRAGTVSAEDVPALLASGGGLETAESLGAEAAKAKAQEARSEALSRALNPIQAYAGYQEALARGATLGLSDQALTGLLGDDYREGAAARASNPATAIPELGGAAGAMVAGELLAGPAGGAAGAARATGALGKLAGAVTAPGRVLGAAGRAGEALGAGGGIIGRGLGMAGRGAAEGGLIGAGGEVSAAALEDRDLTVDKLFAAAGHGALMGGALNVAARGGSKLLGAAGKAALDGMGGGKGLGESLADFAERRAFKHSTGNAVKYYNEASNFGRDPERINRIGRKLLDNGFTKEDPVQAANMARAKLEESGQAMRAIADQLDASGVRVDPRGVLSQVDEQIAKLRGIDLQDFQDIARRIDRKVAPIRKRAEDGADYGFTEFWQLRQAVDKVARWAKRSRNPAEEEVVKLRGILDDALDDAVDPIPSRVRAHPEMAEQFGRVIRGEVPEQELRFLRNGYRDQSLGYLRKAYEAGLDPTDVAAGRVTPPGFNRPLDPIRIDIFPDNPIPSMGDGRHRLMLAQKNGATEIRAIVNVFDEAGDELASVERVIPLPGMPRVEPDLRGAWLKAKEDFSDFRIVRDALQDQNLRNEKNRFSSPSDYFSGGMAFLSAVMSGGSALAGLATAAGTSLIHKQLREKGPGAIARIADTISKLDGRTNKAIEAAISGRPKDLPELPKRTVPLLAALADTGEAPVRTPSTERERYDRTLRLVRDLGSDNPSPEAARRLGNATRALAEDFPELASLLNERVVAAARALNARAPVPLQRPNPLQQHLEERRVPAGLISKWLREVDGADMPESIWHDIARGRVPREKIEIIKETQPYLFADWRTRVMQVVSQRGEKLSRPQRIRLSLAFDFTGDPSIDPARIAQIQSEYAALREQQQAQPPGPPPGGANISSKTADDMKPATEQSFLATG